MAPAVARRRAPAPTLRSTSRRPVRRGGARIGPARARAGGAADVVRQGPPIKLPPGPQNRDPRFQQALKKLDQTATGARKHAPASAKAAQAQAAALPPPNEKLAGAKANQVDEMQGAEAGKPEASSFLALLRAEIAKVMPKKLGDTESFMQGEKKGELRGALTGNIDRQRNEAAGGIRTASAQAPDTGRVAGKELTPLRAEAARTPAPVNAAAAMPEPKPEADVSLQQSKQEADKSLSDAQVTPEQLRKANDPRFSAVLTARGAVDRQADSAPQKYRIEEQKTLGQAQAKAAVDERKGLAGFQGVMGRVGGMVRSRQQDAKAQDEAKRKAVADKIEGIFARTKEKVEAKLASLDTDVSAMFDQGIEAAMTKMTDTVDSLMFKWKALRYAIAPWLWVKDQLLPLPDAVNAFYEQGRRVFTQELDALVVRVAGLVEGRLKEAKDEIASGQKEIRDYVATLDPSLKAVGLAAEKEMNSRFDELRQGVDDKKSELAQNLAQRYNEATQQAGDKLKEMKDANKGLIAAMKEKLEAVVEALRNFKNRIMGMIKQGQKAIDIIVADPIQFLKYLLEAIKKGINQFKDNIWEHLKAGFIAWMLGTLKDAGVQVPKDLTPGSLLLLALQILGITYEKMRAKAVKLIGPKAVMIIEMVGKAIYLLITVGPEKLWEQAKEFVGNLKETVIDGIKSWAISAIIKAAITKLATMFNPVGAIVQAILTIYNTVMFFIERINQILDFVEAIVSSILNIALGQIASAANWIEKALARTIPLIIAFLARLLGLGGLSDTIKEIIKKVQTAVDKGIDWVIAKVVAGIKKLFGKGKPDERTEEQKEAAVKAAIGEVKALGKLQRKWPILLISLARIKRKYKLTELTASNATGVLEVKAVINPEMTLELTDDEGIAKAIADAARPQIETLPNTATDVDVQSILDGVLKTFPKLKDAYLKYEPKGEYTAVSLMSRGESTSIGQIWSKAKLYEPITGVAGHPNQKLFRNKANKKQFVLDAKGQYVPRQLFRSLSPKDVETIGSEGTIEPTGPRSRVTPLEHVIGKKPSPFISITKLKQIVNPHGESFTTQGIVTIDLLYINPNNIMDLSTPVGQAEWGLSSPKGKAAIQALKDVVRTQEVLIKGKIPREAIRS